MQTNPITGIDVDEGALIDQVFLDVFPVDTIPFSPKKR